MFPNRFYVFCVVALALTAGSAFAAEAPNQISTEISNRMSNRLGFYLGVNEPTPVLVGLNAAYHLTDFLRLSAGYGKESVGGSSMSGGGITINIPEVSTTVIGFATKASMPGWNLTPTLGLGFSNVSYGGMTGPADEQGSHVYASVGADYQARSGFNASTGIQQSFKSGFGTTVFVTAGWFVDWI